MPSAKTPKARGLLFGLRRFGANILEVAKSITGVTDLFSGIGGVLTSLTLLLMTLVILVLVLRSRSPIDEAPTDKSTSTTASSPAAAPEAGLDGESHVTPVTGHDQNGRTAKFDVYVWDQRFNWVLSENASVELGGHPVDFAHHLSMPAIRARMQQAQALIAVGSASQEVETVEREEQRSDERAEQLATWLEETINKPTYTLSLGRYHPTNAQLLSPATTRRQRPVAIIGVVGCTDGVVLKEALADALYRQNRAFPFDSTKYARFDLSVEALSCVDNQIK